MQLIEFIFKVTYVTFCIGTLFYFFYPRYEIIDENHRFDKVSGKSEIKTFNGNWRE